MGKIVKYCATCEESFAEKFAFCPNCGQPMTAFEMNPVIKDAVPEPAKTAAVIDNAAVQTSESVALETAPEIETPPITETVAPVSVTEVGTSPITEVIQPVSLNDMPEEEAQIVASDDIDDVEAEKIEEPPVEETPIETKTFAAAAGATHNYQTTKLNSPAAFNAQTTQSNDGFNVTVIEEKNVKQRNILLLGTMAFMITLVLGGTVYSLFHKELGVGAIDGGDLFAYVPVVDDVPMEVEEQPKPKNDKDGGGGGGGGKEEPEPASKGRLPTQTKEPLNPPSVNVPQVTNPTLRYDMSTQGNIVRPRTAERIGLPGSDNLNPSNGTGRGNGVGSGNGVGIGGGNGTGEGNGNGSGSGNGNGNGNGDGTGDGTGRRNPPPPPPTAPVGVTEGVKIVSKPRANYTDAARQNQVQGTVTLRVTFTANGSIGSISPVSGLPYGLTEQAIAAARGIRFEPAKKNGVAQTVVKQVQYSFTIY